MSTPTKTVTGERNETSARGLEEVQLHPILHDLNRSKVSLLVFPSIAGDERDKRGFVHRVATALDHELLVANTRIRDLEAQRDELRRAAKLIRILANGRGVADLGDGRTETVVLAPKTYAQLDDAIANASR